MKPNILIIDDEISICESLQGVLEDERYTAQIAQWREGDSYP